MARKINAKTQIKKLLDKTEVDEKLLGKIKEALEKTDVDDKILDVYAEAKESGLLDRIKCYVKCYGGYVLAIGTGHLFEINAWWGLGFLVATCIWANKVTVCKYK